MCPEANEPQPTPLVGPDGQPVGQPKEQPPESTKTPEEILAADPEALLCETAFVVFKKAGESGWIAESDFTRAAHIAVMRAATHADFLHAAAEIKADIAALKAGKQVAVMMAQQAAAVMQRQQAQQAVQGLGDLRRGPVPS